MPYGLVGKSLRHSYSVPLHEQLGDTPYVLFSLNEDEFDAFMLAKHFDGINVTIPYKRRVMLFCDGLDAVAAEIGAVNTVVHRGGKLFGHNTDAAGLARLIGSLGVPVRGLCALVLGSGGTSHTARAVLRQLGAAEILVASRHPDEGETSYEAALERRDVQLIINTTPVGMYPNNGESPVSLAEFPNLLAVADAVYNPMKTALVLEAEKRGIPAAGGLLMLAEQARAASELFLNKTQPPQVTERLVSTLRKKMLNLVLIGMPGCGKSSLGAALAERTGRRFADLDGEIERQNSRGPQQIIEAEGEEAFRQLETQAAGTLGKESGLVVATGGGAILREGTLDALRQNGVLLWIDCPAEKLPLCEGRPLAKSREDLRRLEVERWDLYKRAADGKIEYHSDFEENLCRLEALADSLL